LQFLFFLEIVLGSGVIGNQHFKIRAIKVFQYSFLIFCGVPLLAVMGLVSASSYNINTIYSYQISTVAELSRLGSGLNPLLKSFLLILLILEFIMIIVLVVILVYVGTVLSRASSLVSKKIFRDLFVRYLGLVGALFFCNSK